MTETNDRQDGPDGWQLEDNSADAYERYLVPEMFRPWADHLVEAAALQSDDRVLDVGCGTGVVARRAAAELGPDGAVVGLDPNEGMLDVATAAWAGGGASEEDGGPEDGPPPVEWRRGEAADLPFPAAAFDVALCQQVLQFVEDPRAAIEEMHRVLAPDGRLGLAVWRPIAFHPSYVTLADALERHVGDEAATMMRSPFSAWDLPELRDVVEAAGFGKVAITIGIGSMRYPSPAEFVRREAASSPLAGPLGSLEPEARDALLRDVREGLRAHTDDEGVVFPMEAYLVAARP